MSVAPKGENVYPYKDPNKDDYDSAACFTRETDYCVVVIIVKMSRKKFGSSSKSSEKIARARARANPLGPEGGEESEESIKDLGASRQRSTGQFKIPRGKFREKITRHSWR